MEVLREGNNFRLAEAAELPGILEFISGHLPDALRFHHTLRTFVHDRVWDFYFYVSKSWPEEPVALQFPAMTKPPNGRLYDSLDVFCPLGRLECLSLLEGEAVLVDWGRPLHLEDAHEAIVERIRDFYEPRLGTVHIPMRCDAFVLQEDGDEDRDIPPLVDADLRQLCGAKHASLVFEDPEGGSPFPKKETECLEVFERLMDKLPALGVFARPSGELVAWFLQSYHGAMGSLRTQPPYRRRGYGTHLMLELARRVRQRGYVPFSLIRPEREASVAMHSRLGFRRTHRTVRAVLRPAAAATHAENQNL